MAEIVRRLAFSVAVVSFFPLDDLIREFPESPEGLVAEIDAGFLPEEIEGRFMTDSISKTDRL